MSSLLIRQSDGTWREPENAGYALESELQEILASHPELIPGVSSSANTCREFQSGVGPADIVVVDSTGELTLVECKLASNPQIRREVVGQMFDYASRLWKMDIEEFSAKWRARTDRPLFPDDPDDATALRETLEQNLAEGRFRIVLAVDLINTPLKRMIEYLNAMSGTATSVIAVEYSRLRQGSLEILMPRTYGQELAEAKTAPESRNRIAWDESSFRTWVQENDISNAASFDMFITAALAAGMPFTGSTTVAPAGSLQIINRSNVRLGTLSLFYYTGKGTSVELNFTRLAKLPEAQKPRTALDTFLAQLEAIPELHEVAVNLRASDFTSRKPNVSLSGLSAEAIRKIMDALNTLKEST
jgi:hypothetical protein